MRKLVIVLTFLFVLLKVLGIGLVASWPWWLVLIPLWIIPAFIIGFPISICLISFVIGIVISICALIIVGIMDIIERIHFRAKG